MQIDKLIQLMSFSGSRYAARFLENSSLIKVQAGINSLVTLNHFIRHTSTYEKADTKLDSRNSAQSKQERCAKIKKNITEKHKKRQRRRQAEIAI